MCFKKIKMLWLIVLFACSACVFSQEEADPNTLKEEFKALSDEKKACVGQFIALNILTILDPKEVDDVMGKVIDVLKNEGGGADGFDNFLNTASEALPEEKYKLTLEQIKKAITTCNTGMNKDFGSHLPQLGCETQSYIHNL